jgi:hypothetical protein
VSRDIPAPAAALFVLLADPANHPALDGTGMAQSAEGNAPLTKVGETFVMNMTHWSLGDYGMENLVVEFEPNRRIVWQPRAHTYEAQPFPGDKNRPEIRYWGWELEPLGADLTRVSEFFDGSRLSEGLRTFIQDGEFWRKGMISSLENLERLALGSEAPRPDQAAKRKNYFDEVHRSD